MHTNGRFLGVKTWSVADARANFGKVLDEARMGRDQIITSRGSTPVRVTASTEPAPREPYLHYLVMALAERDAQDLVLDMWRGGPGEGRPVLQHIPPNLSGDLFAWIFHEVNPFWATEYVRAMLITLRTLEEEMELPLSSLSDVLGGLRLTMGSRGPAIVNDEEFVRGLRELVLATFPGEDAPSVLGELA